MADDNKILLSIDIDASEAQEKIEDAIGTTVSSPRGPVGGRAPSRAPASQDRPTDAINKMHDTLKRLAVATVFQTQIQIRSGSIVQTALSTTADLLRNISSASVASGNILTGIAARLASAGLATVNQLADMGRGFIGQAARFNPQVMAAMARRNMAELMSEIQLSRRVGPSAVRALEAERGLLQAPERIDAVAMLRKLAIGATRRVAEAELGAYQTIAPGISAIQSGEAMEKVKDAASKVAEGFGNLKLMLDGAAESVASFLSGLSGSSGQGNSAGKQLVGPPDQYNLNDVVRQVGVLGAKAMESIRGLLPVPQDWETEWRLRGGDLQETSPYSETERTVQRSMVLP